MTFEWLRVNAEALILMIAVSIAGGAAQYVRKIQSKKALFSLTELVGEIVVSASAGITAGLLVIDHASMPLTLAAASVAGHMGTRFIYAMESIIVARIRARVGQ